MKKRRLLLFSLAFFVGVVLIIPSSRLCLWGWLRGEPCYRGRPVCRWGHDLSDWSFELESSLIILDEDSLVVFETPRRWRRLPSLVDQLVEKVGIRRQDEATIVGSIPPLAGGDELAVPVLLALTKSENPVTRRAAIGALGELGPKARDAFECLVEMIEDEDLQVSDAARWAVYQVDSEAAKQAGIVTVEDTMLKRRWPVDTPRRMATRRE